MAKKIGGILGLIIGFILWKLGIVGLLVAVILVVPLASGLFIGLISLLPGGKDEPKFSEHHEGGIQTDDSNHPWVCPKCKNSNPNSTYTCESCGYSLV
jgi:hypothetical protein